VTTSVGQAILRQCEAMAAAAVDSERLVAGRDKLAVGTVRVTATASLAYRVILPTVGALVHKRHPGLQVDVSAGVRVLDISRSEADIAVRVMASHPTESRLICRRIGAVGYALYASPQYLRDRPLLKRGGGLRGHELISYTLEPTPFGQAFMGESLEGAHISVSTNDPFLQLKATADGLGISELACFFADDYPGVTRVWPHEPPRTWPVWWIVHEDLVRAARIRVVSSAIAQTFQREAGLLRCGKGSSA
jgi:DNA-binding transcriptional LysR family regulator